MSISFHPLDKSYFALLLKWLETPHVKLWWDNDIEYDIKLVREKFASHIHETPISAKNEKLIYSYIIFYNNIPIGYVQAYNAYSFAEENGLDISHIPDPTAGMDIFIGEEKFLGRGLGVKSIKEFLKEFIFHHYKACLVDPYSENYRAIKIYEKIGFKIIKNLSDDKITYMIKEKK